MNKIFDLSQLPNRRFGVRDCIVTDPRMDIGRAIQIVQHDMARNLAETIMAEDTFFSCDSYPGTLAYRADVIVLTVAEYADLCHQKFRDGVYHGQGSVRMMPL